MKAGLTRAMVYSFFAGVILLAIGIFWWSIPAGFIFLGIVGLALAYGAHESSKKYPPEATDG